MNAYITSLIRTGVPVVVGTVAAFLISHGLPDINAAAVDVWLTPVAIGGYYAAVRGAEKKWPQAGWLLGKAAQIAYAAPDAKVIPSAGGGAVVVPAVNVLDTSTPAKHDTVG
jgi:hypothetical protein